jgi:hypothetical protein
MLLPDHKRTIGAQLAMSHACRFRHATAPSRFLSLSVVGTAHCLTCDTRLFGDNLVFARCLDAAIEWTFWLSWVLRRRAAACGHADLTRREQGRAGNEAAAAAC